MTDIKNFIDTCGINKTCCGEPEILTEEDIKERMEALAELDKDPNYLEKMMEVTNRVKEYCGKCKASKGTSLCVKLFQNKKCINSQIQEYNDTLDKALDALNEVVIRAMHLEENCVLDNNSIIAKSVWADIKMMQERNNKKEGVNNE